MTSCPQWVTWRREERDGKPTKVPYQPNGLPASTTDPATWSTYDEVCAAEGSDGVGFVFSPVDGICGIDLDDISTAGGMHTEAARIVAKLRTYTERSPSGKGVHILLAARLDSDRHRTKSTPWGGDFEVYDRGRFFTITGDRIESGAEAIEPRQDELQELLAEIFPPPSPNGSGIGPATVVSLPDDHDLLDRARQAKDGAKFTQLYDSGDLSGYASRSEAVLALCNLLGFWCGPDAERVDHLFRGSALMDEKWESPRGDSTWGAQQIEKAISGAREFYTHSDRAGESATPEKDEEPVPPFALDIDDFIADKREAPEPLVGSTDDCIIPALGFALLIAKGGKGKTTFSIELALHLASGMDYLGLEVPRPLNVLFVENEGPREPFRRKLERKRQNWSQEIEGAIFVYDQNWGHARLDTPEFVERLNRFCGEQEIELVIGDPLDSLGMEGEGSPSETRAMVDRFKDAGLFTERAWLVPHHSRKESVQDAVDEAAGAWGGRPDAMLALEKRRENTARLSFAKVRWQGKERNAYILDFDPESETFTFVKEEEAEERDYLVEVEDFLGETPLKTFREIGEAIGASRDKVEETIKAHPDRFDSVTGDAAKAAGRHSNAVLWLLASPQKPDEPDSDFRGVS